MLLKLRVWGKKTEKLVVWVTEFAADTYFSFLLLDVLHMYLTPNRPVIFIQNNFLVQLIMQLFCFNAKTRDDLYTDSEKPG